MNRSPYVVALLALVGPLVAACESEARPGAPVLRDSAGVTIVQFGSVDLEALPQLELHGEPIVSVGVLDGPEEYQFYGVADSHLRRDGSIAVLDRTRTLRVFDASGPHLWSAGGEGDGPGEFRQPQRVLELEGGTLVVWDVGPGRFTTFVDPGRHLSVETHDQLAASALALGLAGPDRVLLERRLIERGVIDGIPAVTVDSELYVTEPGSGQLTRSGREPLAIEYQEIDEGGAFSPAIFGATAVLAPATGGYWYGDASEYELRLSTGEDRVGTIVRWEGSDRTVRGSDVDAIIELWSVSAREEARELIRQYGRTHPRADRFPAYEELLTDGEGRLWVRDFVREHADDGVRRWTIFSPDGTRMIGRLRHEAAFRPLRVERDRILGVERDAMDVEKIVLRRVIERGDPASGGTGSRPSVSPKAPV